MRAPRPTRFLALCLAVGIQSLWAACGGGDGSGDITAPEVGALDVSTETEGVEQDPDGYTIAVDGGAPRKIGTNASLRFENLAQGIHSVVLGGAAQNCSVSGNGSATAQVVRGETASLRFVVNCLATTGAIEVTTSTGTDADADGYSLLLDGVEVRTIGASATVTLTAVNAGPHTVGLSGIAANCQVQGENPLALDVTAGATAAVAIVVACEPPPPTTGSLRLSASTTGESLPSGYTVSVDDGSPQPIGANATIALSNLAPGSHTVRLGGVADNCTVSAPNPRTLDVSAGGTAETTFTVQCTAVTGALRVTTRTTGSALDADGYDVTVDAGASTSIGVNANRTIRDLAAGSHQVALSGVAANCQVQGENPRGVTVTDGPAATTTFEVVCAATSGSLTITITGLPAGVDAAVTVTGPNNYSQTLRATRTLGDLTPGSYTVAAAQVANGTDQYTATPETQIASVTAGATASTGIAYARVPGATLNLRIEGLYLTQSVQTLSRDVPLVEGRDGMLRVFAVANESNAVRPDVRVRLFDGNTLRQTFTIPAPQSSTPTSLNEDALERSWNVAVPGSLIRRGLQIVADVDPANAVVESDESDNALPVSGPRLQPEVRTAPVLRVTLVPVLQSANDLQGDVTEANQNRYVDQIRRMYPVSEVDADVHAVYTTEFQGALEPGNGNNAWNEVLNEVLALQAFEGTDRNYYGVVRTGYPDGMNGNGFLEAPAAIGYDNASDGGRVAAHEMGHNWGRLHSACGNPLDVDPAYPHANGTIGVFGLDVAGVALKTPSQPDIMGYCGNPWISDYNYKAVLDYRAQASATREDRAQTSVLVWGRIVGGQAILEPAFQIVTRPTRPRRGGSYSVSGYAADGSRLFEFPFDAARVADDPRGARQFAVAIPIAESASGRLATLRLSGPGVQATASARTTVAAPQLADASLSLKSSAAGVALNWKAETHPMVVVRDPVTGEVLSFARGGRVEIRTSRRELDLVVSDGLRSTVTRARVTDR